MRSRKFACLGIVVALSIAGCTSGDDDDSADVEADDTSDTATDDTAADTDAPADDRAPGVTEDTVKIGVNYVDTGALVAVGLNYDLGDFEGAYQALFDAINADGGINGRMLEAVFAPIDPTGPTSADAACLKLTEDDDVFLITGFFLNDAVLCPLDAHETAVVGGMMTPARVELAKAPWITDLPDTDLPESVLETLAETGELDGSVAVFAATQDRTTMEDIVLPKLDELGIETVDTAVMDAPVDDTAALQSNVSLISERFESSGADTIVLVGPAAANWPLYQVESDYRPKLLFLDVVAARAFGTNAAVADTSQLDTSISGGPYGPDQARWEAMADCVAILDAAGATSPPPDDFDVNDRSNQPYQAGFFACPNMALVTALLEAAGEDLNYGTLQAAMDGLTLVVPGDPGERVYGPAPAGDGNPLAYLFTWNGDKRDFELVGG